MGRRLREVKKCEACPESMCTEFLKVTKMLISTKKKLPGYIST